MGTALGWADGNLTLGRHDQRVRASLPNIAAHLEPALMLPAVAVAALVLTLVRRSVARSSRAREFKAEQHFIRRTSDGGGARRPHPRCTLQPSAAHAATHT